MFLLALSSSLWEPEFIGSTRICFLFFELLYLSHFSFSFSILFFMFCDLLNFSALQVFSLTLIFSFCSSSVFSNSDIFFLHSSFFVCFSPWLTISLFLNFLSWFGLLSCCCPIVLHSIAFVFSLSSSLSFFLLSLSLSLFLFPFSVFTIFSFYLSVFDLDFAVLLFFLRWIPDVLTLFVVLYSFCSSISHQFDFCFFFFPLHYFFSSLLLAFFQTLLFCLDFCRV